MEGAWVTEWAISQSRLWYENLPVTMLLLTFGVVIAFNPLWLIFKCYRDAHQKQNISLLTGLHNRCTWECNLHNRCRQTRLWASLVVQSVKNPPAVQETRFDDPWVGKIPWRRKWQPTPVFLPGESQGQRNLEGYSPWGHNSWTQLSH